MVTTSQQSEPSTLRILNPLDLHHWYHFINGSWYEENPMDSGWEQVHMYLRTTYAHGWKPSLPISPSHSPFFLFLVYSIYARQDSHIPITSWWGWTLGLQGGQDLPTTRVMFGQRPFGTSPSLQGAFGTQKKIIKNLMSYFWRDIIRLG